MIMMFKMIWIWNYYIKSINITITLIAIIIILILITKWITNTIYSKFLHINLDLIVLNKDH